MSTGRKNTKVNSQITSNVKTRAQSKSQNNDKIRKFYGITHEIQIKLLKLKPVPLSTTNKYKCNICSRKLKTMNNLQAHLQTHQEKTIFCSVRNCKYKCSILKILNVHVLRAHVPEKLKPFKCTFCKFGTHLASNLKIRMKNLHNPKIKRFNCTECNFTTAKPAMLNTHVFRWHGGKKPAQCSDCTFRAKNKSTMALHWKSIHGNQTKRPRPFKCLQPECIYAGLTSQKLLLHMRTHTGEKPFKCQFCPYASTQRSNWKAHERIHTNEKPYACTLCPYKCKYRHYLDSHMRTHTGERPYACSKCKYRAAQSGHLSDHFRRFHTPEGRLKKFECPLCQDTFYRLATLESHMTRHTGERPFKCRFCGRGLSQSNARKLHEKKCVIRKDESS